MEIDSHLNVYIIGECSEQKLADFLLNTTIDTFLDVLSPDDVYKNFALCLENINGNIHTWQQDNDHPSEIHMMVIVVHKNEVFFSHIGEASCYLIRNNGEILEVSEKAENKEALNNTTFGFISNGNMGQ